MCLLFYQWIHQVHVPHRYKITVSTASLQTLNSVYFFSVYKTTPCQGAQLWLFILITAIIKIFLSFQVCVSRWGWAYEGHPCLWDMCFCMFNGTEKLSPSITLCLFSESGLVLQLGAWGILFCFVFVVVGYFFFCFTRSHKSPEFTHLCFIGPWATGLPGAHLAMSLQGTKLQFSDSRVHTLAGKPFLCLNSTFSHYCSLLFLNRQ